MLKLLILRTLLVQLSLTSASLDYLLCLYIPQRIHFAYSPYVVSLAGYQSKAFSLISLTVPALLALLVFLASLAFKITLIT